MVIRSYFGRLLGVLLLCIGLVHAEEEPSEPSKPSPFLNVLLWPFEHVIQPALNGLIFPIAAPVDYAFKNGIIEKTVDLITFGEERNILIYPGFNFKPGSSTMIGVNYRHRSLVFSRDYLVFQPSYYANGDAEFVLRYTKQALFGTSLFGGFRFDLDWNRDSHFIIPETKSSFLQPDSSMKFSWRLGMPVPKTTNWNMELSTTLFLNRASHPDVVDSILISSDYPIEDRGLYQDMIQVPVSVSLVYDDLDYSYAPSRGNRFGVTATYYFIGNYSGVRYEDLGLNPLMYEDDEIRDAGKEHDYFQTNFLFQHYFFLGKGSNYILSATEARKNRRFYTDFSWDEMMRVWKPEQVRSTLFERRVIALQFRMVNIWEMEEGGAPYNAFATLNARTPLRGYSSGWSTSNLMSLSVEYRWPVDRFVDGVLFDEYAMISPKIDKWNFSNYYNSWGFGIRVRQPNMYLFRIQFGFHGLHGVNLVMTIAPEFK